MADKPRRKRRRVLSVEAIQQDVASADERSCSDTCEDELFQFRNKRTTMEVLEEETLKQIQSELIEDCRNEDGWVDEDGRRGRRNYKAWNIVDQRHVETNTRQMKSGRDGDRGGQERPAGVAGDNSSEDDDDDYLYVPSCYDPTTSATSQTLLSNVARTLHNLKSNKATPSSANDSIIDCTALSPTPDTNYNITLRIRCRGRTYRYSTLTVKPFSEVMSRLADDLGVVKERILLSYQAEGVPLNATPDSLGLTTVDFLDALVVEKAITEDPVLLPEDDREQITIKVQSISKTINYRLHKADPLDKVLAAFAAAVEVSQEQVKFEFDGDPVMPGNTAEQLGLEDDDVIDARITRD